MYKILIADDNDDELMLYKELLTEAGFTTYVTSNSEKVIEMVKQLKPDLVILDIVMPGKNGLTLLEEILSLNRKLPIILLSAHPEYKLNLRCWGADAFITKSSDLKKLLNTISKLLGKYRA